ncbi:hypothetical protein SAMN05892883_2058 [Jatrophihabitans sp. GAS493]|uniref:hypothetical protein n=1 Tax=Jatrophihabitans sp. GAS493 TaxID=1907575 RepID=UPI000BB98A6F|nr:hypothetical protein [Jatrophihabitans sp. GAS493]SOD72707.1 hypothetical protein SAMN05892883_2058 [Jatrophihabitans sp. GAS493]
MTKLSTMLLSTATALDPHFKNDRQPVVNAATEWHNRPNTTFQSTPYPLTRFGSVDNVGGIWVNELDHTSGKQKSIYIEQAIQDDHCTAAVHSEPGHRTLMAWTKHNFDNVMRLRVGALDGSIDSLANVQSVTLTSGGTAISYTQIVRLVAASTTTTDQYWILTRRSNIAWEIIPVAVNIATGTAVYGAETTVWRSSAHQLYIGMAHDYADKRVPGANQKIRVSAFNNPGDRVSDGLDSATWYFEVDCVTGTMTCPSMPSMTATTVPTIQNSNTSANLPLDLPGITPLITETGSPGVNSRRVFQTCAGPDSPAIAYAEGAIATPDAWNYFVKEAGPRVAGLFNGLVNNGGYASCAAPGTAMSTTGMILEFDFTLPATAQDFFIYRQYPGLFYAKGGVDNNLTVLFRDTGGTNITITTTSTPLAGLWGTRLRLRLAINPTSAGVAFTGTSIGTVAAHTVKYDVTTDGGTTYSTWGPGTKVFTGSTALPASATDPVATPTTSGASLGVAAIHLLRMAKVDGTNTLLTNFESGWPGHQATYTDTTGNAWTLTGGAIVERTTEAAIPYTWTVRSYGPAGTRVGYSTDANYLAGGAFQSPSYKRQVVFAKTDGTTETLTLFTRQVDGVTDTATVLLTQPTGSGRVIRPYFPDCPTGPAPYIVTYANATFYGTDYTQYNMDRKLVG